MRERPMLFQDAMVRAILDGQKTQTRRLVKLQPRSRADIGSYGAGMPFIRNPDNASKNLDCLYGQPGDRLWVREAFAYSLNEEAKEQCYYRATDDDNMDIERWYPSIHMPRAACRLVLEIVSVRVERLQDISRGDAMAEGCPFPNLNGKEVGKTDPVGWFHDLWTSINGDGSWAANPWVWVVEFRRAGP